MLLWLSISITRCRCAEHVGPIVKTVRHGALAARNRFAVHFEIWAGTPSWSSYQSAVELDLVIEADHTQTKVGVGVEVEGRHSTWYSND